MLGVWGATSLVCDIRGVCVCVCVSVCVCVCEGCRVCGAGQSGWSVGVEGRVEGEGACVTVGAEVQDCGARRMASVCETRGGRGHRGDLLPLTRPFSGP